MRKSIGTFLGVATGVGIAAAAARRMSSQQDRFYDWQGENLVLTDTGTLRYSLPITYHRTEQVVSVHPVAFDPVRAILPTDALHPVRLPDGRALLGVTAARYLEGTAEGMDPRELPYGESMIMVAVTTEPSPRAVPIVRGMLPGSGRPPFGWFLLHLATTKRDGRDMGRALGYPAFVADFAFEDDVDERRVQVSDGDREILRLRVATRGRITPDRRPSVIYAVRGEELLEIVSPCSGHAQQQMGRHSGLLELGDHPVADELRALEPEAAPLLTRSYLNLRLIIAPPRVVGPVRPYAGYAGADREGAYRIRYPDGSVIDLAAPAAPAASRTPRARRTKA